MRTERRRGWKGERGGSGHGRGGRRISHGRWRRREPKDCLTWRECRGRPPIGEANDHSMACHGGRRRWGLPHSGSQKQNRASGSWPPGPAFRSNRHSPGNERAPWSIRHQSMQLRGGAQKNIDQLQKRRPGTWGIRHRSQRRYARRKCRTQRGHGRRGWTARRRRYGEAIGPGVP